MSLRNKQKRKKSKGGQSLPAGYPWGTLNHAVQLILLSVDTLKHLFLKKKLHVNDLQVFLGTNEIKEDSSNYYTVSAIYTNLEAKETGGPIDLINIALIKV